RPARRRRWRTQLKSSPVWRDGPKRAVRRPRDISPAIAANPASATASCARVLAEQPAAQPAGRDIDDKDRDDDGQQDGADVGIVEFADRDDELLADAAGA